MRAANYRFRERRGAVLLLVIGAVAILSILAVELAHRANLDVSRAARSRREAAFRRTFDSGLEIANGLLIEGRKNAAYDFAGDRWSHKTSVELGPGERVTVQVEDESGKLNIAAAMGNDDQAGSLRKSLARAMDYLRKHDPECDKQWQDIDVALRSRLGIDSKDRPSALVTLDGLRESGIPLEFVFGADLNGEAGHQTHPALCDMLTTFGNGKINLNTAAPAVLYSLDQEYDDDLTAQINAWRGSDSNGDSSSLRPFQKPEDLQLVPGIIVRGTVDGKPQVIKDLYQKVKDKIMVQSNCFSVRMIAEVDGFKRMAWAFFEVQPSAPANSTAVTTMKLLAYEEIEP
jgi:hypothetical protein